jgi:hypothetical protein
MIALHMARYCIYNGHNVGSVHCSCSSPYNDEIVILCMARMVNYILTRMIPVNMASIVANVMIGMIDLYVTRVVAIIMTRMIVQYVTSTVA